MPQHATSCEITRPNMHSHNDARIASHGRQAALAKTRGSGNTCGDLTISEGYEELLRRHNLNSLDALFAYSAGERLDKLGLDPWRQRWRMTFEEGGKTRTLYLKRFQVPPRAARSSVRRSGSGAASLAGNEWEWIQRFAADGIPCVQAVAFGQEMRGFREVRSAILTSAVAGQSLERWAADWSAADRTTIRRLIPATADLISRLHGRGYIHRDLYLSHLFFDPSQPIEQSLFLIDLQRVIRPQWCFRRWIVKDLAALNYSTPSHLVSKADRVRWLRGYLGIEKLDDMARRLLYRVVGKTQRIAERERRRR